MSPEEADASARHVAPELSEHDLAHLGAYQVAARLVVGGEETPAFTLRTRAASPERVGRATAVRKAAASPTAGRSSGLDTLSSTRRRRRWNPAPATTSERRIRGCGAGQPETGQPGAFRLALLFGAHVSGVV